MQKGSPEHFCSFSRGFMMSPLCIFAPESCCLLILVSARMGVFSALLKCALIVVAEEGETSVSSFHSIRFAVWFIPKIINDLSSFVQMLFSLTLQRDPYTEIAASYSAICVNVICIKAAPEKYVNIFLILCLPFLFIYFIFILCVLSHFFVWKFITVRLFIENLQQASTIEWTEKNEAAWNLLPLSDRCLQQDEQSSTVLFHGNWLQLLLGGFPRCLPGIEGN